MITVDEIKQQFRQIAVWKRGAQRAPHKPLLLLYALGRCLNDDRRLIAYTDVDRDLRELLMEFGPERKSCHTEYPFWRLQNDGVWELRNAERVEPRKSNNDAKKSELLKYGVSDDVPICFPDTIGGYLRGSNFDRYVWYPIREAAGISETVTFHDLRHTQASLMLHAGADMKIIQQRLGHADFSTTANTYAHLLQNAQAQATEKLSVLMGQT